MKPRCEKRRKNGTRCKNAAVDGSMFCYCHLAYVNQPDDNFLRQSQHSPPIDNELLARLGYFAIGAGIVFVVFYILQESANVDFLKKYGDYPMSHFIFGILFPLLFFLFRNSSHTTNVETLRQVHRSPILHVLQSKVYDTKQIDVGPAPYKMSGLALVIATSYPVFIWTFVNDGAIGSRTGSASFIYLCVLAAAIVIGKSSKNAERYSSTSLAAILASFMFWIVACFR